VRGFILETRILDFYLRILFWMDTVALRIPVWGPHCYEDGPAAVQVEEELVEVDLPGLLDDDIIVIFAEVVDD